MLSTGKRFSIGLAKYKYTSFDAKQKPVTRSTNKTSDTKPSLLKVSNRSQSCFANVGYYLG